LLNAAARYARCPVFLSAYCSENRLIDDRSAHSAAVASAADQEAGTTTAVWTGERLPAQHNVACIAPFSRYKWRRNR